MMGMEPDELERAISTARADIQAANEIVAIVTERVSATHPDPDNWTGGQMALSFLFAAWRASASTAKPLTGAQFAGVLRRFADTIESHPNAG